jgi:hypothetical protein
METFRAARIARMHNEIVEFNQTMQVTTHWMSGFEYRKSANARLERTIKWARLPTHR